MGNFCRGIALKALKKYGQIEWIDLTVGSAEDIKDFYSQVIGWVPETGAICALYEKACS